MSRLNDALLHYGRIRNEIIQDSHIMPRDGYAELSECYKAVEGSDFYYYLVGQDIEDAEDVPRIPYELMKAFYNQASHEFHKFASSQNILHELGNQVHDKTITVEEQTVIGAFALSHCCRLVSAFQAVNSAPISPSQSLNHRNSRWQMQFAALRKELGSQKDETFRETLRRYIPKWMTNTLALPEFLSDTEREQLEKDWTHYTPKESALLVHPDNTSAGSPVHRALELAETLDNPSTAYQVKAWTIINTLRAEDDDDESTELKLMQFFRHIFGSLLVSKSKQPIKDSYFGFEAAIQTFVSETYKRFYNELADDQDGSATIFLDQLATFYPQQFPEMVALSIFEYASTIQRVGAVDLAQRLKQSTLPWAAEVYSHIEAQPIRRVLNGEEAEKLLQLINLDESESNEDEISQAALDLTQENDIYTFSISPSELGILTDDKKDLVTVEVDSVIDEISVKLRLSAEAVTRIVSFEINFSGNIDDIELDTDTDVSEEAKKQAKSLVLVALRSELDRMRLREEKKTVTGQRSSKLDTFSVETATLKPEKTREERMSEYKKKRKVVKKARINELKQQQLSPQPINRSAYVEDESRETDSNIFIEGLDFETVKQLLAEEKIEHIDPETLINKVRLIAQMSAVSKRMLGKRIDTSNFYREIVWDIDLRQINWMTDGGKTAVRIYLEDIGEGKFKLRGILNKKGDEMQTRYITKLLRRIRKEET